MSARDPLSRPLANGEAPVYLLHGAEGLLVRRAMDWLRRTVLGGFPEDFNLDRFDGKEKGVAERVVDAARTLPMMAPRRLVWVQNAEAAFGTGDAWAPLLRYVEKPDPTACVVLQALTAVDKRGRLYKALDKHACVYEAKAPYERELPGWLVQQARERGRELRPDAAAFLVATVGRDLGTLDTALERLTLFVEAPAPIELAHVEEAIVHTRARTVWELVDAVADRKLGPALAHAHDLVGQGEAPIKIVSLVLDRIRKLIVGRSARANGATPQQAAAAAGIAPFLAASFGRQVEAWSGAALLAALERVAAADRALKSSRVDDELLLEGLLMELCGAGRGDR